MRFSKFCFPLIALALFTWFPGTADANKCIENSRPPAIYYKEVRAMEKALYTTSTSNIKGDRAYNARVLYCNRKRDNRRKKIKKYRDANLGPGGIVNDFPKNMPRRLIKGKIYYYGKFWMKYGYYLARKN